MDKKKEKKQEQHKGRPGHIHERQQKRSLVGIKKETQTNSTLQNTDPFFFA